MQQHAQWKQDMGETCMQGPPAASAARLNRQGGMAWAGRPHLL